MFHLSRAVVFAALLAVSQAALADPAPNAATQGAAAANGNPILSPAEANTKAPVGASADASINDIHCLVIYMLMGGAEDAKLQAASVTGTLYFTGKLDGRDPNLDIEGHILSELPNLNGEFLKSEAQRCGAELTARGKNEIAMTEDLQQRVEKMQQGQSPH